MQKILILSDTHGYIDDRMKEYVSKADEVWHAGDIGSIDVFDTIKSIKPLKAVYGNIDNETIRLCTAKELHFSCEDVPVFMTHIGGYPDKYAIGINNQLLTLKPKLFISGHSHILKVIYDKKLNILHINPGAIGKHGFHLVRTMVTLEIDKNDIKNLKIIEFKKES